MHRIAARVCSENSCGAGINETRRPGSSSFGFLGGEGAGINKPAALAPRPSEFGLKQRKSEKYAQVTLKK